MSWNTRIKWVAGLLGAALGLLVAVQVSTGRPDAIRVTVAAGQLKLGSPAPDFSSRSLDGAAVRLSELRGRPVVVDFWATWCTACEVEMPEFQRVTERYRSRGVTVVAVNYRQTNATEMRRFMTKLGARFPAVYDPEGRIATAYGVSMGLPVSVFIDRAGKVRAIQLGQMSSPVLDDKLRTIV